MSKTLSEQQTTSTPSEECLVISLGGAIENGSATIPKGSIVLHHHVRDAVKKMDLGSDYNFYMPVFNTKPDFKEIARRIEMHSAPYVIIADDLNQIPAHSRKLEKLLGKNPKGKVVVFTGANTGLMEDPHSEGYKNLAVAMTEKSSYLPGVHIVMDGKWCLPEELPVKDWGTRIKESLNTLRGVGRH